MFFSLQLFTAFLLIQSDVLTAASTKPTSKPSVKSAVKPSAKPTSRVPTKKPTNKPTNKPTLKVASKPTVKPTGCPIYSFGTLGSFPFCPSVVPLVYNRDEFSDPAVPFQFLDKADENNGLNGFSTPLPSIRKSVQVIRNSYYYYFYCASEARLLYTVDINESFDQAEVLTIRTSDAPELCAALAAVRIISAAPSVFVKLPCVNISVPALAPGKFPMCKVFINPDNSYKCIDGIRLAFGGSEVGSPFCQYSIYDSAWKYIAGQDPEEIGYFENPYPSIKILALGDFVDMKVYIVCGSTSGSYSYAGDDIFHLYTVLTVTSADAPELCAALGPAVSRKPTRKPSQKVSVKPSVKPSRKPSVKPSRKPTRKPTV